MNETMNTLKDSRELAMATPTINGNQRLESFAPPVGSDEVTAEAVRSGTNRHVAATQLAARKCPAEALEPALQVAREELEAAERARMEAERKINELLRKRTALEHARAELEQRRIDLAAGEDRLELCKGAADRLKSKFSHWLRMEPTGELHALVLDSVLAREMCKHLPAWIEGERAALVRFEAEVAALAGELEGNP